MARVWLVHAGEPLPIDEGERPLRVSLLADALRQAGHEVIWITTSFDHNRKQQRTIVQRTVDLGPAYRLILLPAPAYEKNVSLRRLANHYMLARRFTAAAPALPRPDIVVASLPPVELAAAAVRYARRRAIPSVVDVHDLHPDIYRAIIPPFLKPIACVGVAALARWARRALSDATAIVGISDRFLDWGLAKAGRERLPTDAVFPIGYPAHEPNRAAVAAARVRLAGSGVDFDKRLIIYAGSLNRWIDLAPVLDGAHQLAAAGVRDPEFIIAGDGDHMAKWRGMAETLPNVRFLGWVNWSALAALLGGAWAGVAPYAQTFETFGNKIFEYMSAGLPILFSGRDEVFSSLAQHGCLLRYADGRSLVRCVRELLQDPESHGRIRHASRAAFDRCYRHDEIYRRMAEYTVGLVNGARV